MSRLNKRFGAVLQKGTSKGRSTYVVWPASVGFFGTRVAQNPGKIDGYAFRGSFMAMGSGKHMLPVKADVRKAIGKEAGQRVTVQLTERLK
jgi:uncharacterized protein DUF1905